MKTDNNNQVNNEKLARYLSGEMDKAEEEVFLQNELASGGDLSKIEIMKNQWSGINQFAGQKEPDASTAWRKVYGRLENDDLLPDKKNGFKIRLSPLFLKTAAIIIVLIATGVFVYLNSEQKPAVEMVQLNTSNENNTLIKTLEDGSVIYLAQNSLFSFPVEFEKESRKVELKGEAFFDIASNPEKPFIIETEEAIIQVLGTAFNIKSQNNKGFELTVERGKVKVTLKSDPSSSQFVIAGEKISSVQNNLVKAKQTTHTEWYKQQMHFKDETLQNIISVLNKNFNTTFVINEKETGNQKLTVTFNNETAETMTELICLTLNLKSQTINGSVVLSEKTENSSK
jgi:ferric-dicitrate binding protein FerR (iron transport regulator)